MDWEREASFAKPQQRKPLIVLRDTEALLRRKTVTTLVPVLPSPLRYRLQQASEIADESLYELAEIDIERINDTELQPARILIGLSFVGFGALFTAFMLLYLSTLHPELNSAAQIRRYWYFYVWFVCLGVAGLFVLGREAMRSHLSPHSVNYQKKIYRESHWRQY